MALSKPPAIAALLLSTLALTACGESTQEKAKAQVCSARSDISKQVATLTTLPLSSNSLTQAKTGLQAIGKDLTTIKNAQANLQPARKEQVQAATHTFETQLSSIVSGLGSNLSLNNVEAQLKSALAQLATSYKQTLAPINCS
jgi:cell division protein FtsB